MKATELAARILTDLREAAPAGMTTAALAVDEPEYAAKGVLDTLRQRGYVGTVDNLWVLTEAGAAWMDET